MIVPPPYSNVEPGSHPHILNREHQPQDQFHRQRQQHTDRKKLKRQVLQQAGARQKLLLQTGFFGNSRSGRSEILLEIDRHQPVEEQRADQIEPADHDQPKNELPGITLQKSEMQRLTDQLVAIMSCRSTFLSNTTAL